MDISDYKSIAHIVEEKWQALWDIRRVYHTVNPGDNGFDSSRPKYVILDFFPYPSGIGLHVGHPLGYIATDVKARFMRMRGYNVLHSMGFDSFGLPAEQFAIQTGQHPRITTTNNIENMLSQLKLLGLGHDPDRRFSTTDPDYYKWTQWIFLQLFNSFYDPTVRWTAPNGHSVVGRARPIHELEALLKVGTWVVGSDGKPVPASQPTSQALSTGEIGSAVDRARLAYLDEVPVNWCPALGTVLSNEEVTREGRSERGDHPVYRRPLKQWVLRITDYADRLISDLADVDWPDGIKEMQYNWIGRSSGAEVTFQIDGISDNVIVFTTRPETLGGVTFLAVSPNHPLLPRLTTNEHRAAVKDYRESVGAPSNKPLGTGIFTGSFAVNPIDGTRVPIWVADYVLAEYGTGAVMGVPAHDERDFQFAMTNNLPVRAVIMPTDEWLREHSQSQGVSLQDSYVQNPTSFGNAFTEVGEMVDAAYLPKMKIAGTSCVSAASVIVNWLEQHDCGKRKTRYKLRDWLFSRQRYWGEPFPIVYDSSGAAHALDVSVLPVELPPLNDFAPLVDSDPASEPSPPLSRAEGWTEINGVALDDGSVLPTPSCEVGETIEIRGATRKVERFRRELNTMPNWAGSCWYYLRYFDPHNDDAFVDPVIERYWSLSPDPPRRAGSVDMYVGGAEHAVLHLLYARFWHKVLYDLGHVSTNEPFQALFNQGMITADAFRDARGIYHDANEVIVTEVNGTRVARDKTTGEPLEIVAGKMGKRYKNGVAPEEICSEFSVDTFRLYELYMGPLEMSKPWQTSAVVGMMRFLSAVWRNVARVAVGGSDHEQEISLIANKTIVKVTADIENFRLNTAIAALIEFNHFVSKQREPLPGDVLTLGLLLAPFAPHISEEIVSRLVPDRHRSYGSVVHMQWPTARQLSSELEVIEIAVTVNGKLRARFAAPASASDEELRKRAEEVESIKKTLASHTITRAIVIRNNRSNIVNFVVHAS